MKLFTFQRTQESSIKSLENEAIKRLSDDESSNLNVELKTESPELAYFIISKARMTTFTERYSHCMLFFEKKVALQLKRTYL